MVCEDASSEPFASFAKPRTVAPRPWTNRSGASSNVCPKSIFSKCCYRMSAARWRPGGFDGCMVGCMIWLCIYTLDIVYLQPHNCTTFVAYTIQYMHLIVQFSFHFMISLLMPNMISEIVDLEASTLEGAAGILELLEREIALRDSRVIAKRIPRQMNYVLQHMNLASLVSLGSRLEGNFPKVWSQELKYLRQVARASIVNWRVCWILKDLASGPEFCCAASTSVWVQLCLSSIAGPFSSLFSNSP